MPDRTPGEGPERPDPPPSSADAERTPGIGDGATAGGDAKGTAAGRPGAFERLLNEAGEGTDAAGLEEAVAKAYPLPATVEQAWAEYRYIDDRATAMDVGDPGPALGPAMEARRRVVERLLLADLPAATFADLRCRVMFLRHRHQLELSYDPEPHLPLIDALLADLDRLAAMGGEGRTVPLRRSNADKRRAVLEFLRDPERRQWSNREIASQAGVSPQTVANLRHALSAQTGQIFDRERAVFRNGRFYTMRTANIGQTRKSKPARPPAPGPAAPAPRAPVEAPARAGATATVPAPGTAARKLLREQLHEQLQRRLKEYYAERGRSSPRP